MQNKRRSSSGEHYFTSLCLIVHVLKLEYMRTDPLWTVK